MPEENRELREEIINLSGPVVQARFKQLKFFRLRLMEWRGVSRLRGDLLLITWRLAEPLKWLTLNWAKFGAKTSLIATFKILLVCYFQVMFSL